MKSIILILFLSIIISTDCWGGTGAIPSGQNIKLLKDNLRFKTTDTKIMSGDSDDPTAVAKDAEIGSIYIRSTTGVLYQKQDSGSSTNWLPLLIGPSGSGTDDCVPRWDGTGVPVLQDSLFCITDAGAGSGLTLLDVDNVRIDGNTISSTDTNGNINISPDGTGKVVINSDLDVIGTVTHVAASSMDVTNATITVNDGGNQATADSLDSGLIVSMSDATDATIHYDSSLVSKFAAGEIGSTDEIITATAAQDISGKTSLEVDNIRVDGNTISSTDVNGNIILDPNGTGQVNLPDLTISQPAYIDASGNLVSQDINLANDTTGVLQIVNGGTNSSTPLNNNRMMISSSGSIIEHSALTQGSVFFGDANGLPAEDTQFFTWDDTNNGLALGAPTVSGAVNGTAVTAGFVSHVDNTSTKAEAAFSRHENTTASIGATIYGARTRGTQPSPLAVQSGDRLFSILGLGYDGTDWNQSSRIDMSVDATPGANDMPGRIVFRTSPDGTQNPSEAMRIDSNQDVILSGDLYTSLTADSVPYIGASGLLTENNPGFTYDGSSLVLSSGGSSTLVDLTQSGSGTTFNINNSGSGDFVVVNTSDFVIDNGGDVGIGVASPDDSLDVVGTAQIDNLGFDGNTISSRDTNGNVTIDPNGTGEIDVNAPILLAEHSTPATPTTNEHKIYFKSDGDPYKLNDGGIERPIDRKIEEDFLLNRSFELSTAGTPFPAGGWVNVNGTATPSTSTYFDNDGRSMEIALSAASIDLSQAITVNQYAGQDVFFSCQVKSSDATVQLCTEIAGTEYECTEAYDGSDEWRPMVASVPGQSSGTIGVQLKSSSMTDSVFVDDCRFSSQAPYAYKNLTITSSVHAEGNGGESITAGATDITFTEVSDSHGAWDGTTYTVQNGNSTILISGAMYFTSTGVRQPAVYINGTIAKQRNGKDASSTTHPFEFIIDPSEISTGDSITIRSQNAGGTLSSSSTLHYLTITEEWQSEHVVTPAKADTESYSISAITSNFWDATGDTNNFDISLIPLAGSDLVEWNDTTQTRLVAKKKVKVDVSITSQQPSGASTQIYNSSGAQIAFATSGAASSYTTASIEIVLERDDYLYFRSQNGSVRDGGITIVARPYEATFLAAIPVQKTAYIKDVKTSGTDGGTSSTTPVARTLNTVEGDTGIVSLSSNQFTLNKGTYEIEWSAPAYKSGRHQTALYNATSASYHTIGATSFNNDPNNVQTNSVGYAKVEITGATAFEIHHEVEISSATNGWGVNSGGALSITTEEVYTQVKITKIK